MLISCRPARLSGSSSSPARLRDRPVSVGHTTRRQAEFGRLCDGDDELRTEREALAAGEYDDLYRAQPGGLGDIVQDARKRDAFCNTRMRSKATMLTRRRTVVGRQNRQGAREATCCTRHDGYPSAVDRASAMGHICRGNMLSGSRPGVAASSAQQSIGNWVDRGSVAAGPDGIAMPRRGRNSKSA